MDTQRIDALLAAHGITATLHSFEHHSYRGTPVGISHVWHARRGQMGVSATGWWYAYADYPDAQILAYSGDMEGTNSPEAAVEALANHLAWASEAWDDYETLRVFGADFEDGDFDAREMYE